jgi:Domain of unknown function (DUF4352)
VNISGEEMDKIGQYTEALPKKTFLVVHMVLENHGYKAFDINPNFFTVVVDKVAYPYDKAESET